MNKALIRPDSEPVLQDLFRGIQGAQGTVIIEGHTSTEGSEEDNLELSKRRAQAVVDKLQALGINQSRLEASGKGELMPLVPENDETSRALNRRVEIKCR